jgi:hypothetical protein
MDQGPGVGQGGAGGETELRLCTLGAQSEADADGGIQARGGTTPDGKETEPWEILYFKAYKSQLTVIEQALETASLMFGGRNARGYCLEMICADFLAGAKLDVSGSSDSLLLALRRIYLLVTNPQRQDFLLRIPKAS